MGKVALLSPFVAKVACKFTCATFDLGGNVDPRGQTSLGVDPLRVHTAASMDGDPLSHQLFTLYAPETLHTIVCVVFVFFLANCQGLEAGAFPTLEISVPPSSNQSNQLILHTCVG